jgi:hypothetical protein
MDRRRRNRHASPRPKRAFGPAGNPNNVIPADRPLTSDEIIAGYGQAQLRLDPLSNREFEIVMYVICFIKDYLGLPELTNEVVAMAIQMTDRGMYNRKIIIIKKSNDLSASQPRQVGLSKPPTRPNGGSSGLVGSGLPTEEDA